MTIYGPITCQVWNTTAILPTATGIGLAEGKNVGDGAWITPVIALPRQIPAARSMINLITSYLGAADNFIFVMRNENIK